MKFIDVHTHQKNNLENVIAVKNHFPAETFSTNSYYSVGIHPWYIVDNLISNELIMVENHLQNSTCIAIGECGLDKLCKTDFELQKKVFISQLILAEKHQKPVIVHCVKAHQELIEIIKKNTISIPIILHGFSKKESVHQLLLSVSNLYFSFGKSLLSSITTEENFKNTPLDKVFLETDDSNLTIENLYLKAATLKKISTETLRNQIVLNFQNVFTKDLNN